MNYQEILIFKNYSNFTCIDIYDYSTYNFNDQEKPSIDNFVLWNIEFKKEKCKSKSKELIANCDWSVLPDVNLQNKSQFENYRSRLRELIVNPVENPVFPIEPDPIWSK